jgi:hypothetical protein
MEYETRLPAIHLRSATVAKLEDVLRRESTDPELEIRLEHGPVVYRYSSAEELSNDVGLPGIVRSFEVVLAAKEGEIELTADDHGAEFTMRLSGERSWVRSRRRTIEAFFRRHGATVRTLLERYLALALGSLAVVAGLAVYHLGFADVVQMRAPVDALLYGCLALMGGGVLHIVLNRLYPYAAIVTDGRLGR